MRESSMFWQLLLRMRQPRLFGPNNVLLAYPRKLPSLLVDLRPIIERKAINSAEQSKPALKVQKFNEAWRRHEQEESTIVESEERTVPRKQPSVQTGTQFSSGSGEPQPSSSEASPQLPRPTVATPRGTQG